MASSVVKQDLGNIVNFDRFVSKQMVQHWQNSQSSIIRFERNEKIDDATLVQGRLM